MRRHYLTKTSQECLLWHKTILQTCDNWDTDYNSYNWEPKFMTIFVTWQSRVTVDSIRNSCDVYFWGVDYCLLLLLFITIIIWGVDYYQYSGPWSFSTGDGTLTPVRCCYYLAVHWKERKNHETLSLTVAFLKSISKPDKYPTPRIALSVRLLGTKFQLHHL